MTVMKGGLPPLLAFVPFAVSVAVLCLIVQTPGQSPPDLVILNANIRTMDRANPRAEAVAARDGRITAVGSTDEIRKLVDKETKVIDANGKLVLPGFNDAHAHFMAIGNLFSSIDLGDARSEADVLAKFRHFVRFLPKGRWILGGKLDASIVLSRAKVDAATPDNPVFVFHTDPKSSFANSIALHTAKIESSSGVLDANGTRSVQFVVPKDHIRDWPMIAEIASNYAASFGVTSIQDTHSDDLAAVYREVYRQGKLKTRIYDCISLSNWAKLAAVGTKAGSGDPMVRTGCVKGFYDPEDPETADLGKNISAADSAGLQVLIHAIGREANRAVLFAFEKAINANGDRDRRFRVEHAGGIASVDVNRFARSKIIPSMQPILFAGDDDYRKMLDSGARVAFGADAPMRGFNPLEGIYAAVNADAKRRITVEEAVYAYTMGAAFAEFQEKEKGSIAVGNLADLVVLSNDIFVTRADIRDATVWMTVVNGRIVYENTK
ncbi:MAG TPA: amidohydrolase [Pyrinomonadaceae bacterium]|nr:amidohydrolase [Pyrinomonadaceae bacterium]